ncbi:MAG: HNH endonuclease [Desulfovibrio sp.]|nr:HNH endonuclease [Desulfovibrio sp.]
MNPNWTPEETRQAVYAYLYMLDKERAGEAYSKTQIRRALQERLSRRSPSSLERRFQNISAVLAEDGKTFVKGYLPLANVGRGVASVIRKVVSEVESTPQLVEEALGFAVRCEYLALDKASSGKGRPRGLPDGLWTERPGRRMPARRRAETCLFSRDPKLKAWLVLRSRGLCEFCGARAPFEEAPDMPYLEVHHVVPLAREGWDVPANAVALCPNCHRAMHFAADREERVRRLYALVARLDADAFGADEA